MHQVKLICSQEYIRDELKFICKYLYYFSTVYYNNDYTKSHSINSLNIVEEIESCNAVVIINSAHNLNGFPYGLEKKIDELILALK